MVKVALAVRYFDVAGRTEDPCLALLYTVGGTQDILGGDESASAYIVDLISVIVKNQSHPGVFVFLPQKYIVATPRPISNNLPSPLFLHVSYHSLYPFY